jgi:hypothetical protein
MKWIRPRLTQSDLELIVSALLARSAGSGALRRHECRRLAERLAEASPGNPKWCHSENTQTHASDLIRE